MTSFRPAVLPVRTEQAASKFSDQNVGFIGLCTPCPSVRSTAAHGAQGEPPFLAVASSRATEVALAIAPARWHVALMRTVPHHLLFVLCTLAGCSSHGGDVRNADGGPPDLAASGGTDLAAGRDLATVGDAATVADSALAVDLTPSGPTADQCLEGWRMYGGACPAPTITQSYVGNGCVGTAGWFVEGQNFQLEQHNMGIADYGPQSFGANGNQKHWNIITTTKLCVTVAAAFKDTWVGHTIYVKNPDGKASNSVVVQDKL